MAKRADEERARQQIGNSAQRRVRRGPVGIKTVTARMHEKRATLGSVKGRAVHGPTKSRADAKAGKPGDGKKIARYRTGPNGGEDQTSNGVRGPGRGADGPPGKTPSRKSTRGSWAAGEKRQAKLTDRAIARTSSSKARATRGR